MYTHAGTTEQFGAQRVWLASFYSFRNIKDEYTLVLKLFFSDYLHVYYV